MRAPLIFAIFLLGFCRTIDAADLKVGPGKSFARLEEALSKAAPGDTILVHPKPGNAPYEQVALFVKTPRLTIRAVGEKPIPLHGRGFDYSGVGSTPRAIVQFNRGADACTLEGFELRGAHNRSHNGSGVRINSANNVTIRNCHIHGNDMGIMSNGDGTQETARNQLIIDCHVHSNGDPSHPGYNHNFYLGGTSVVIARCDVHSALTGHNIKSRAHFNAVIGCHIHDSANREIDFVDGIDTTRPGSDSLLFGNLIVKDPECRGNRGVIHFGQDGGKDHDGTIRLVQNHILTPFITPPLQLSAPSARSSGWATFVWHP